MTTATELHATPVADDLAPLRKKMNEIWHEPALRVYTAIVLAHWAEHLAQAFQIYVLGWKVPDARGVLGLYFPWLVSSEVMHYGYALVMLIGLWYLRPGFAGRARTWWTISLAIQFWHHIEHAILQAQAIIGVNLAGRPVATSIAQLWFPRVELHLFYNTIVFLPMAIGMYYHLFPTKEEARAVKCNCAVRRAELAAS